MSAENRFCAKCGKPLPEGAAFCPSCSAPVPGTNTPSSQVSLSGFDVVMKDTTAQSYWVRRIIGFAIDAVIVYVVLGILVAFLSIPFLLVTGPAAIASVFAGTFSFVAGLILVLYFTFAEAYGGATFGKRVVGLKVVVAGGRAPTAGEAILRNISKIYWVLLLLDVVAGLAISKLYTQKYSDRFAGTYVIEGPK